MNFDDFCQLKRTSLLLESWGAKKQKHGVGRLVVFVVWVHHTERRYSIPFSVVMYFYFQVIEEFISKPGEEINNWIHLLLQVLQLQSPYLWIKWLLIFYEHSMYLHNIVNSKFTIYLPNRKHYCMLHFFRYEEVWMHLHLCNANKCIIDDQ